LDVIECKIPAFLIAQFGHALEEICVKWGLSGQHTDKADTQRFRLQLRSHRKRPRRHRAADKRDELAPIHSTTSSARKRIDVGNTIPKLFAVFRLMTSSNFVGNSAGSSAGLAPRSTLATRAAQRKLFTGSTP
jgi:hypothetical protein